MVSQCPPYPFVNDAGYLCSLLSFCCLLLLIQGRKKDALITKNHVPIIRHMCMNTSFSKAAVSADSQYCRRVAVLVMGILLCLIIQWYSPHEPAWEAPCLNFEASHNSCSCARRSVRKLYGSLSLQGVGLGMTLRLYRLGYVTQWLHAPI